jgi:hypothetical protein
MTTFDNQLLLHLRLDALPGGKIADSSSHARHGTVTGTPLVVPDEQFGSSIRFAGKDFVEIAEVTPLAKGANPVHSIAGWVRLDAYPAKRAWILAMGQPAAGAHHWLINPDGRTQLGVWDGGQAAPQLPLGSWVHVTTTFDGKALRVYLDGKQWDKAIPAVFNYTSWQFGVAAPRLPELGYAGRQAAVRVYERVLSIEDIRQVIEEDRSAMAAFRRSHPLAFSLHDMDEQPVLAIVDDPKGNTMRLEVTNTASQTVVLAPVDPATKSHLELRFRPGTLPADWVGKVTVETQDASWASRVAPTTDGTVAFAMACKEQREIKPGETVTFTLRDIGADGRGGTRGTRVQLRYAEMSYPDEPSSLHGRRTQHLSIVNRRGQQHIPLQAGFVGFNTILSDGRTASSLRLRIANVAKLPIPITPSGKDAESAFVLSFDTTPAQWALNTAQNLKSISVTANGWVAETPTEQGKRLTWRLTTPTQIALAPGADILVDLGGLIGRPPSGHTQLYVHYENIPGYWDGHLAVTIEKGPLVCRDMPVTGGVEGRVGIGRIDPDGMLDVARGTAPGGTALFRGTQRISHFNYSTDEHTYLRGGKTASNVYLNDSGGNVAIGSTDPQGHKLLVNGPAKVLGLRINSNHIFNRVQAGHFHAGSHTGGVKEVRIDFPERFGSLPQAVVTARSEGYYEDTYAITVKYIDATHFKVNIMRLDAMKAGWQQNLRLDWIAWE